MIEEVSVKFARPVYVGEELEVAGEVVDRNDLFRQLVLKVTVRNSKGEIVVRGKMKVGFVKKAEEA